LPTFDRSQSIVNSLNDVKETLFIAFVLVIGVIFLFLGRASDTLIPMVALPMSFLITFVAMWGLGYSINNLTLMAMTLAIGFLVDDAIVFLENVVRRAEAGESIYRATLNSAGEISFTILSMTLSLAAVFIPLAFMPAIMRQTSAHPQLTECRSRTRWSNNAARNWHRRLLFVHWKNLFGGSYSAPPKSASMLRPTNLSMLKFVLRVRRYSIP
jgi:hypothetical protein